MVTPVVHTTETFGLVCVAEFVLCWVCVVLSLCCVEFVLCCWGEVWNLRWEDFSSCRQIFCVVNKCTCPLRSLWGGESAARPRSRPSAQSASWEFPDIAAVWRHELFQLRCRSRSQVRLRLLSQLRWWWWWWWCSASSPVSSSTGTFSGGCCCSRSTGRRMFSLWRRSWLKEWRRRRRWRRRRSWWRLLLVSPGCVKSGWRLCSRRRTTALSTDTWTSPWSSERWVRAMMSHWGTDVSVITWRWN